VIASKAIGLEVNVEKTKYMIMSRNQNAVQNHDINIDSKSFERVEEFKYLGTTLMNRDSIHEETKSRLKSECMLSFGAESFVFQVAIQKHKD
jgi:hypothetical protein